MSNEEPRKTVVLKGVGCTPDLARLPDTPDHERDTGIGNHDNTTLTLGEKYRVRCRTPSANNLIQFKTLPYGQSDSSTLGSAFGQKRSKL